MPRPLSLIWLRRDLRLQDHSPLALAEAEAHRAACCFVFDPALLRGLPRQDRRVAFFHAALEELDSELRRRGSALLVRHGDPREEIPRLVQALGARRVIVSRDYEPRAVKRDLQISRELARLGVAFTAVKDQVIFEEREILNGSGEPYRVFSAYRRAWLAALRTEHFERRGKRLPELLPLSGLPLAGWGLDELGFTAVSSWIAPGEKAAAAALRRFRNRLGAYDRDRDFPARQGGSGLSAQLRFGGLSIRACVRAALEDGSPGAKAWLSELIWRDFYQMLLSRFPALAEGNCFRPELDRLRWPGSDQAFAAWAEGMTGFPIVDAAMRHFRRSGWMHNRLRMIVASFLTKDLLVDWRKGEELFARELLDFDLAANNGGWQWCASTGCDAQPWFRVFNPLSQSLRFDPEGEFLRAELPELRQLEGRALHAPPRGTRGYPAPIVDHGRQREKALALFRSLERPAEKDA